MISLNFGLEFYLVDVSHLVSLNFISNITLKKKKNTDYILSKILK